jgi:hypothetical protein
MPSSWMVLLTASMPAPGQPKEVRSPTARALPDVEEEARTRAEHPSRSHLTSVGLGIGASEEAEAVEGLPPQETSCADGDRAGLRAPEEGLS